MEFEPGPISALLEASAAAVGAGMILGGFAAGLAMLFRGGSRDETERAVMGAGYAVGAFCLALRLAELLQTI
jgi:hypothetical protein